MMVYSVNSTWERRLYDLAHDISCSPVEAMRPQEFRFWMDQKVNAAVESCEAITAEHSRSFYVASGLLPTEKRRAMRALYAFCRTADDLADSNVDQPALRLNHLRRGISGQIDTTGDEVLTAWSVIRAAYHIPVCYAEQLLDGVERDLIQSRYETFEDLSVYCYSVASTVGLMSMRITGYSDQLAIPYAIKLGVALQLTNILRDVGEDWQAGRLYLPLDELSAFGLCEQDVASGKVHPRWRSFMRFQIARARQLYAEAMPGISMLHRDGRFAVSAAAMLYRGILDSIEAHDYNVFNRRAFVSSPRKFALLARAFAYARLNRYKKIRSYSNVVIDSEPLED